MRSNATIEHARQQHPELPMQFIDGSPALPPVRPPPKRPPPIIVLPDEEPAGKRPKTFPPVPRLDQQAEAPPASLPAPVKPTPLSDQEEEDKPPTMAELMGHLKKLARENASLRREMAKAQAPPAVVVKQEPV